MNKKQILNILFWIFLIIGISMIIWRIFGNSPTDLEILIPFIIMMLLKLWANNENMREVKYQVILLEKGTKTSFEKVRDDLNNIKLNLRKK
jgi:hypothetical protein